MKSILCLLCILVSSCSVYHSRSVSVEEAVESKNRIKVITENDVSYKFRQLLVKNNNPVGLAHANSNTARKLSDFPVERKGKFLYMDLSETDIEKIKLKNNTLSVLISILIPLAAISTPIVVLAAEGPGMPGYQ